MFSTIFGIATLAVALAGGVLSFGFARGFIRRRLRFVDAVYSPLPPWVAGGLALLVAAPLTLLPLVTGFTAAMMALGAWLGARSGVKALRRGGGGWGGAGRWSFGIGHWSLVIGHWSSVIGHRSSAIGRKPLTNDR